MRRVGAALCLALAVGACGKKGDPLAPLRLVPAAPTGLTLVRRGDEVRLRFVLPTRNENGPGRIDLDRVEIYAATIAAGATAPPNRDLVSATHLVGTIEVKPAPVEGEPVVEGDRRPSPGETVTFLETLTPAKLQPQIAATPVAAPPADAPAAAAPAVPALPAPQHPVRLYAMRGLTTGGRPGPASVRVELPLVELPPPPAGVTTTFSETAVTVAWTAPPASEGAAAVAFNVYRADASEPLNPKPLATPQFEQAGAQFGVEQCFRVRTVRTIGTVAIESAPTDPACVTPADTFPPAAPKGLATVPGPGVINLIWDANTEGDLAGYLVLRGGAADEKLQPLTPEPIRGTTFADTTVTPNVRYVYAIVAVDTATPPNRSAESTRAAETAR